MSKKNNAPSGAEKEAEEAAARAAAEGAAKQEADEAAARAAAEAAAKQEADEAAARAAAEAAKKKAAEVAGGPVKTFVVTSPILADGQLIEIGTKIEINRRQYDAVKDAVDGSW